MDWQSIELLRENTNVRIGYPIAYPVASAYTHPQQNRCAKHGPATAQRHCRTACDYPITNADDAH